MPLIRTLLIVGTVGVIGLLLLGLFVGIEPPTAHVEQVIPNDRFPR